MVAERHRGTITVESTLGAGSVFTVRMPGGAAVREVVSA
jgi:signal transduction histidine kinase